MLEIEFTLKVKSNGKNYFVANSFRFFCGLRAWFLNPKKGKQQKQGVNGFCVQKKQQYDILYGYRFQTMLLRKYTCLQI